MPQRATSTSFGAKQGNTPKGNNPKRAGPGRPPKTFYDRMAAHADKLAEASQWANAAKEGADPDTFFKAFDRAAAYGYGKPAQAVDVTSAGEKLAGLVMMPHEDAP